jgi:hypothetical protein
MNARAVWAETGSLIRCCRGLPTMCHRKPDSQSSCAFLACADDGR